MISFTPTVQSSVKAIIFDCDGTLVSSEEAHFSAWQQVMKNRGDDLSIQDLVFFIGKSDALIARLLAYKLQTKDPTLLLLEKKSFFLELLQQGFPSIEGTVQFVHRLLQEKEKLNLKLAVASAADKDEILLNLKGLHLENSFDIILSGQSDLQDYHDPEGVNKPKPYIYLHAAKLLDVSPQECVVIEDSHTGVTASADAGCFTIAIPNTWTKHQDLSKASLQLESLQNFSVEKFLETISSLKNFKEGSSPVR
ncbi:MAG: HAD family phosphatase [Parachlamydiales bacterium]|nr:HAD family phosphatase [Parachlamydiales bacterium]